MQQHSAVNIKKFTINNQLAISRFYYLLITWQLRAGGIQRQQKKNPKTHRSLLIWKITHGLLDLLWYFQEPPFLITAGNHQNKANKHSLLLLKMRLFCKTQSFRQSKQA